MTTSTIRARRAPARSKLIKEDGVKFIMMLGGDPWPGA